MSTYGRNVIGRAGFGIKVSADGEPTAKIGGITVNWASVAAAGADYEVRPNGEVGSSNIGAFMAQPVDFVTAGTKYLRWGTVMCKLIGGTSAGKYVPYGASTNLGGGTLGTLNGDMVILNASIHENDSGSDHPEAIVGGKLFKDRLIVNYAKSQTITMGATGGTFTVGYKGQTSSALAYNITAANMQTALEALSTIGAGKVTVSLSGSVYTVVLADSLGVHEPFVLGVGSLTGGSATLGVTAGSLYGPTPTEFVTAFPTVIYVTD